MAANADAPLLIELPMNKYLQTRPSVYEESFKSKQMHLTGVSYQSEDVGVLTGAYRFLSFHLYIVSRRKQHSKGEFFIHNSGIRMVGTEC